MISVKRCIVWRKNLPAKNARNRLGGDTAVTRARGGVVPRPLIPWALRTLGIEPARAHAWGYG
jgi:hypothetical protein